MRLERIAAMTSLMQKVDAVVSPSNKNRESFLAQTRELRSRLSGASEDFALRDFGAFIKAREVAVDSLGIHWKVGAEKYTIDDDWDLQSAIARAVLDLEELNITADFSHRYQ